MGNGLDLKGCYVVHIGVITEHFTDIQETASEMSDDFLPDRLSK